MTGLAEIVSRIKARRLFVLILLLLSIWDFLLLSFPLTGDFHYEYAVLNALAITFFTALWLRSEIKYDRIQLLPKPFLYSLLRTCTPLILMPFLLGLLVVVFLRDCNPVPGILFYVIFVFPAPLLGIPLGFISVYFSKRFSFLILAAVYLVILISPIFDFFFFPQVCFFNYLITYFPGVIFDTDIYITWSIVGYKFYSTAFALGLGFFFYLIFSKRKIFSRNTILLVIAAVPVLLYALAFLFRFITTGGELRAQLPVTLESEHCIVYTGEGVDSTEARYLLLLHEFYYSELFEFFNAEPDGKIQTYVFDDEEQKKEAMGSRNADVAKPWLREIYLTRSSVELTLKHEMAHLFTAPFGVTPLKIADGFHFMLIEGAAEAADPFTEEYPNSYLASIAIEQGYAPQLKELFAQFDFFNVNSTLAYIYSGAFCAFLIERYGIEKFKLFYANANPSEIYQTSLEQLEQEFISSLPVTGSQIDKQRAAYFFGGKPLLQMICPRTLARSLRIARGMIAAKEYEDAASLLLALKEKSGDARIIFYLIAVYEKLSAFDKMGALLNSELSKNPEGQHAFRFSLRLADAEFLQERAFHSYLILDSLARTAPTYGLRSEIDLRLTLLNLPDTLRNILLFETKERAAVLLRTAISSKNKSLLPKLLPSFVRSVSDLILSYKNVQNIYRFPFRVQSSQDAFAALLFARIALKNLDLHTASLYVSRIRTASVDPFILNASEILVKKIEWFNNHL